MSPLLKAAGVQDKEECGRNFPGKDNEQFSGLCLSNKLNGKLT